MNYSDTSRVVRGLALIFRAMLISCVAGVAVSATEESCCDCATQTTPPVMKGAEGRKAFDDLAEYYRDNKNTPPVDKAIEELKSTDPAVRASAGRYLTAIMAQSQADETNGRGNWERSIAWGGGADSDAQLFRSTLAEKLTEGVSAAEALDAAEWLIDRDEITENQALGVMLLCRIKSPKVVEVFRRLLAEPHPNQKVLTSILSHVAANKLNELAPEVRRLAVHYRKAVRDAAVNTAELLGIADLPEYRSEEAFTPRLDKMMKDFVKMVETQVPPDAKLYKYTVTFPPRREGVEPYKMTFNGWQLSDKDGKIKILSLFGSCFDADREQIKADKKRLEIEASSLANAAKEMLEIRKGAPRDAVKALSRNGMFTGQFEPEYISLPEALTAAWLYQRGDKKLAAELFFPRIDASDDDRWISYSVCNLLGTVYHQDMLEAFSYDRDYAEAIRLAKHLSQPVFGEFAYHDRAKRLAEQLAARGDDFKKFRLPNPEEWTEMKKKLDRRRQIEYLAARLRLLNCFQWGQPGDVDYSDPQFVEAGAGLPFGISPKELGQVSQSGLDMPQQAINPYVELRKMDIKIAELPALVPFLADDNYMPTYSYWRTFHPGRTLHQVNWIVEKIINNVAYRDLAKLSVFNRLDEQGRKKHLDAIIEWCNRQAEKTEKKLLLQTMNEATTWCSFGAAARVAARKGYKEALPILVRRFDDFKHFRDELARLCYRIDSADAAAPARKWLTSDDKKVRFWAALILLRHGDRKKLEGLAELESLLAWDDGSLYPHAIEALVATKNDRAAALACGILKKNREMMTDYQSRMILQQLFLTGRKECLEFILTELDNEQKGGQLSGKYEGKQVERTIVDGDGIAMSISTWRSDGEKYKIFMPDELRRAERKKLKVWLQQQYELIKAGKKPDMKILSGEIILGEAFFDAP